MTDIVGITSAIDHIVYMLLNTLATLLWRLDAAIISMSLYSYGTQDWLTGNSGGGVWGVLDWLIGPGGLAGVTTWTLFGSLALMLWGMAKIAKPFISFQPVDIGKLLIFFVLSYVVISQGTSLMPAIEAWRVGAGSVVYEAISSGDDPVIDVPAAPATSDPLGSPSDLDGTGVIRGWEAVATTYFLVTVPEELHRSYPPDDFLQAYCLYNPELAINTQAVTNSAGCSPRLAWDEWDAMSIDILRDSYGIDLNPILTPVQEFFGWFGITFDFSSLITMIPVTRHHPENRELGIRQAQSGIARLAMGIIVSIFPMVEASISLMLALAASFIYITLPIALLFGFFLPTESMVNRLFMQFAAVVMRTIIIQGMVALFMLILMNTAATGSLSAYIGLVGVGLIGGWVLMGAATGTMKETFSQSMGAVSSIWMGSTTGLLGQGAAAPAAATLGAAKIAGGTALLAAGAWTGGVGRAWDLSDTTSQSNRSGMGDLRAGAPAAAALIEKQRGRLPDSLNRLTSQLGLAAGQEAQAGVNGAAAFSDPGGLLGAPLQLASQLGLTAGIGTPDQGQASTDPHRQSQNGQLGRQSLYSPQDPLLMPRWGAAAMMLPAAPASFAAAGMMTAAANTSEARQRRNAAVDGWIGQSYKARETGTGQRRASEAGRDLLGEELTWKAERAMERHTPAEVNTVVAAARAAAEEGKREELVQNGRLTKKAVEEVQKRLDPDTVQAFQGEKGAWDLAALTAVGLQEQKQAEPDQFRQAMARSKSGWGEDSPAHKVPKELGLDPAAAGSHYTAINRFARLADEANLSEKQREQLLKEAQSGQVSDKTKEALERAITEQQNQGRAQGLKVEALIASASAVPATIAGPEQVWTTPAKPAQVQGGQDAADGALLGIELKRKEKGRKEQEAGEVASAPVTAATAVVSGAAQATTAAAATVSVFSGLVGPAEPPTSGRRGGRDAPGESPAMIGPPRRGTEDDQDGGRTGQVVEPMVAAPTMASRGRGTGTGDPTLPLDAGRGSRHLGQELKGQAYDGEGVAPAPQQPGSTGGAPLTDVASTMRTPVGVVGQIFYAGGEPAQAPQGSGFGQELRAGATGQAPGTVPAGGAPATDISPADSAFGVARTPTGEGASGLVEPAVTELAANVASTMGTPVGVVGQTFYAGGEPAQAPQGSGFDQELRAGAQDSAPIGGGALSTGSGSGDSAFGAARTPLSGGAPGWAEPVATEPAADFVSNMGAPAGVGGQTFYGGGDPTPGSSFGQELRVEIQDPTPTGWTGPATAEPFVDTVTNIETPAGVGGQVVYPSSEFDQPGGFSQEFRPTFPAQDSLPPPVSSPSPAVASPPVDSTFAVARAPIGNIAPDWAGQQAPPAAAPSADFSANMGRIPSDVGSPTTSLNSDSGLSQNSGFGQELRTVVQDPALMPPPVNSPPPAANPPVSGRSETARPPIGETFRQVEPLNIPPMAPAPAAGTPPVTQYTSQPVISTSSVAPNPGYGSSGGFGQELHQAASAPGSTSPPPPPPPSLQPVRQPIGSVTGGPPVVESMVPPPRINPAPAAGVPPMMPPNISQPASTPPTPPPARGQGVTPLSPQQSQRQRTGGGVTAPVQPSPVRTPGATTTPPSAATSPPQTQNVSEPKKGSSRAGDKKEKGKKG